MKQRIIGLFLTACMLFGSAVSVSAADASAAEQTVKALGIMVGDEQGNMNLSADVTRAEFTKMLVAASNYRDTISGDGTGYSLFKDVKSSHWASEYIRTAVEAGWVVGFTDGTYRPEKKITLDEVCSAVLRMLGYDSSMLAGSFPAAQLNKAAALGLRNQVACRPGQNMTRRDCMELFYNLMTAQTAEGRVYGETLGYTMVNGKVDYTAVLGKNLQGPYVAAGGTEKLPFTPVTVYRNGKVATSAALNQYDVYYYNTGTKTAWIYTERASGKVTALMPNSTAPTTVTVSGVTYAIGSPEATYQLSALGGGQVGATVTLLLGMDNAVVQVLTGAAVNTGYYGVVQASHRQSAEKNAKVQTYVTVTCTDGETRTFVLDKDLTFDPGRLVVVNVSDSGTSITGLSTRSLTGTVNGAGTKLGNQSFAEDVQILDTTSDGTAVAVTPNQLAGRTLGSNQVRYYALDEKGCISHLILNDVTGETWQYGYLTNVENNQSEMGGTVFNISYTYTLILNGETRTIISNGIGYPVHTGAVAVRLNADGSIKAMHSINSGRITTLGGTSVMMDNQKYLLSDNVQVYLRQNGALYQTGIAGVNDGEYRLTGWYDAGNRIRVIVAETK